MTTKWSNMNSRRLPPTAMNDIRNCDSEGVELDYCYYKVSFLLGSKKDDKRFILELK